MRVPFAESASAHGVTTAATIAAAAIAAATLVWIRVFMVPPRVVVGRITPCEDAPGDLGRTESTLRDGVPDPWPLGGGRRRPPAHTRRRTAAGAARLVAHPPERGRLDRSHGRRALGCAATQTGDEHDPVLRLDSPQDPRPRPDRHPPAGLPDPCRTRRARSRALRATGGRGHRRVAGGGTGALAWACPRRPGLRVLRAGGNRPPRGAPSSGARAADRRRPRAGP